MGAILGVGLATVAVWVACWAAAGSILARSRGLSGANGAVLGACLGPFGLALVWLLSIGRGVGLRRRLALSADAIDQDLPGRPPAPPPPS